MNKLTALLFIALTCISGCRNARYREKEVRFGPAAVPERTAAKFTPELDPAKTWFPRPTDGEKERPPVPPLVFESTAQQHPGNEESALTLGADSPLFCLLDEKAYGQSIIFGMVCPDLQNEWVASAGDRQEPLAGDPWNFRFATNHRPRFDNGWIGGKTVSVGINETPFNSLNGTPTAVNAFLKVLQGKHGAWLFGLSYSGTGNPVPRIGYIWQPSEKIRANTGLIFPNMDDLFFDLSLGIRR